MRIFIEKANNGIIKTIQDDNIDGAGKKYEKKELFIMDDSIDTTEMFLTELIKDLGLYIGNPHDKENLQIQRSYGSKYTMNHTEIINESKKLTVKLNELKKIRSLKQINENENN